MKRPLLVLIVNYDSASSDKFFLEATFVHTIDDITLLSCTTLLRLHILKPFKLLLDFLVLLV